MKENVLELNQNIRVQSATVERAQIDSDNARSRVFTKHGIRGWSLKENGKSHIDYNNDDGAKGTVHRERVHHFRSGWRVEETKCPGWER